MGFAIGSFVGWVSPGLYLLQSNDSPLPSGPIDIDETSWIGATSNIGIIIGTLIFFIITEKFGYKISVLSIGIPLVICWLLVIFGQNAGYLIASRVFGGIGFSGSYIAPLLIVAEVSDPNIRGFLSSSLMESFYVGVVLSVLSGAYLSYFVNLYVMISIPIIYCILMIFIPNTPAQYLKLGKRDLAEKSLKFYKNCKRDTVEDKQRFKEEMEKVEQFVGETKKQGKLKWADFTSKQAIHGMIFAVIINILNVSSGTLTLTSYTSNIMKKSSSNISSNDTAIAIATIQMIGSMVALIFIDKWGRRPLFIVSSLGTVIGLTVTGVYSFLQSIGTDISGFDWVPVTGLSMAMFFAAVGVNPLRNIIIIETLPPRIRDVGCVVGLYFFSILLFGFAKVFPIILETYGLHVLMWGMAAVTAVGIPLGFFMKETSGKDINVQN